MKKNLFYALMAFATLTFTACDKDKDKNNAEDPQTNQHEYLCLSDLTPLHLIPISQAEAKLNKMGFGSKVVDEESYSYTSSDKKETIICALNSDKLVEGISYTASKGISPSDAKKWLTHVPENVTLPKYSRSIPFTICNFYEDPYWEENPMYVSKTYHQYINLLDELQSGMKVVASWEEDDIPEGETAGYGVVMIYSYSNNVDQAGLYIPCLHHMQPPMAE